MIRGYYTAASGLVTQEKRLNVYANNIANVSTAGYKKDDVVAGTFGEFMAVRMNGYQMGRTSDIGEGVMMQTIVDEYTDHTQGGFEETGRPLDFGIQGQGFFVIADAEGNEYLTRDGQFSLDEFCYLVLPGFGWVQGDMGDILIGTSDVQLAPDGTLYVREDDGEDAEWEDIGLFSIAMPANYEDLVKAENGLFIADNYELLETVGADTVIRQNMVERSNVNVAEEMSRMIESQRSLQSCSQIVKMYDEMAEQMNTRVARV